MGEQLRTFKRQLPQPNPGVRNLRIRPVPVIPYTENIEKVKIQHTSSVAILLQQSEGRSIAWSMLLSLAH